MFAQEKVTKEKGTPTSGSGGYAARLPSFRCRSGGQRTRGVHAPLRLSPHPCGSSPCATPPLGLLTGTRAPSCLVVFLCAARIGRCHAARGIGRASRVARMKSGKGPTPDSRITSGLHKWFGACPSAARGIKIRTTNLQATPNAPFRRPNGIVVEGSEPHGCGERLKGPRMALVSRPLERRWSEGTSPQARPDVGGKRFWLLFPRLEKVTRPAGRNHCHSQHEKEQQHQTQNAKQN